MCACLHPSTSMLHEAQHSELEVDTSLYVRGVWRDGNGDESDPSYNENHSKYCPPSERPYSSSY